MDYEIMLCDVKDDKILTLELGVAPDGKPIYQVSISIAKHWDGTTYRSFKAALKTYKLLLRII